MFIKTKFWNLDLLHLFFLPSQNIFLIFFLETCICIIPTTRTPTPTSTQTQRHAPSSPPSVTLASSISLLSTVWKVDDSDSLWQSSIWMNLMLLIWCLLTALWKWLRVESTDTATLTHPADCLSAWEQHMLTYTCDYTVVQV